MKTKITAVDINPHDRLIWIERLIDPVPQGYTGGRKVRQYRHTIASAFRLFDACTRKGMRWSQDSNGTHFTMPNS